MEEIAHDPAEAGGVVVKRGAVSMKDMSAVADKPGSYSQDDTGRTIVPRTTLSGGVEGGGSPFGNPILARVVEQDEDGMKIVSKKMVALDLNGDEIMEQPAADPVVYSVQKEVPRTQRKGTTNAELKKMVEELDEKIASLKNSRKEPEAEGPVVSGKSIPVTLSGPFGSMTLPYYDAFEAGACVVLVSEFNPGLPSYTPPEQVPMEISFKGSRFKCMNLGIDFPYEGRRLLILIIDS